MCRPFRQTSRSTYASNRHHKCNLSILNLYITKQFPSRSNFQCFFFVSRLHAHRASNVFNERTGVRHTRARIQCPCTTVKTMSIRRRMSELSWQPSIGDFHVSLSSTLLLQRILPITDIIQRRHLHQLHSTLKAWGGA